MKSLMRVVMLLALSMFCTHCSDSIRTIESNARSNVTLRLHPESGGNGVILTCHKDVCTILTTAHLCHPDDLVGEVIDAAKNGDISRDDAGVLLAKYQALLKSRTFCDGLVTIVNGNRETNALATAISVDFTRDLMLLAMRMEDTKSTIQVSNRLEIQPGEVIYTVLIAPSMNDKIVLFNRAGLYVTPVFMDDLEHKQRYLQTNLPIGPGASGAPVFDMNTNSLIGIIGAQMIDGSFAPIKATYVISQEDIRGFLLQYMEQQNDRKLDWPHCSGEEYLCQLVRGEVSLLDSLRHRNAEKSSEKEAPADSSTDCGIDGMGSSEADSGI